MRQPADYVLLYDGRCAPCTELGRRVHALGVPDLHVLSFDDPQVDARLLTDRPALVRESPRGTSYLTGLRMRLALVRLLGVRRSREIIRLAGAELRARRSR